MSLEAGQFTFFLLGVALHIRFAKKRVRQHANGESQLNSSVAYLVPLHLVPIRNGVAGTVVSW